MNLFFLLICLYANKVSCLENENSLNGINQNDHKNSKEDDNQPTNINIGNVKASSPGIQSKKTVFITGSTGVMGTETLKQYVKHLSEFHLKLLVRPSNKNKKTMKKILSKYNNGDKENNIEVIWGDLLNYEDVLRGVEGSDYVLHIGGSVSPKCDLYPYLTYKTNVYGAKHVVDAVLAQKNKDEIKVCYIGSVAETGNRNYPIHWGRTGDPIKISIYDHYGTSKVLAERLFVESGLKNWVVLRQSGILNPGLFHLIEPIIFHVPLNDVLEWATVEDSGRLMLNLVLYDVKNKLPKEFWNRFYNIGSGEEYRLTNYQFYSLMYNYVGLGKLEPTFEPNWFTTKNFHGHYYLDGDLLDNYLHFRANIPLHDYLAETIKNVDLFFRIPSYIPFKSLVALVVKPIMKYLSGTKTVGTRTWIKTNDTNRLTAFYGSYDEFLKVPTKWSDFKLEFYNTSLSDGIKYKLNHGYNENKPLNELDLNDMKDAAKFRGGEIVSNEMIKGDLSTKLTWRCGHCGKTLKQAQI